LQMDGSTQQNAALVEQSAAAAEQMAAQAEALTGLVARFKLRDAMLIAAPSAFRPTQRPLRTGQAASPASLPRRAAPVTTRKNAADAGDWKEF
jgi:methyl-accepting chemotaxis protein